MKRTIAAATLLAISTPAFAEVMDKELSIPQIWELTAVGIALAVGASLVNRWLLLLSFVIALLVGPTFAWTEWHTADVGPALEGEAGAAYGIHANAAMSALVLAHLSCWTISSNRCRRRLERMERRHPRIERRLALQAIAFSCYVMILMIGASWSGFPTESRIWLSLPLVLSAAAVLITVGRWAMGEIASRPTTA